LRQAHPTLRRHGSIVEIDPADVGLTEIHKTYVPVTFVESAAAVHREAMLAHDFTDIHELVFPGDKRKVMDIRRSGVVEGHRERHRCGRSLGEACTIVHSNELHKIYAPVKFEAVRKADDAPPQGRPTTRVAIEGG
jgi:hypothetical protein